MAFLVGTSYSELTFGSVDNSATKSQNTAIFKYDNIMMVIVLLFCFHKLINGVAEI
jgi:hypothetical protein